MIAMAVIGCGHERYHVLACTQIRRFAGVAEEAAQHGSVGLHGTLAVGVRGKDLAQVGGDTVLPQQAQAHAQSSTPEFQSIIDKRTVNGIDYGGGVTVDVEYTASIEYNGNKMEGMHVLCNFLPHIRWSVSVSHQSASCQVVMQNTIALYIDFYL